MRGAPTAVGLGDPVCTGDAGVGLREGDEKGPNLGRCAWKLPLWPEDWLRVLGTFPLTQPRPPRPPPPTASPDPTLFFLEQGNKREKERGGDANKNPLPPFCI